MGVSLVGVGCDKELEIEPQDSLTTEQALSTIGGINAALVGMYADMRSVDYYGRSLFVYGDLSGDDVYLSRTNSNRYLTTYRRNYASNDADILGMWTAMYRTISRANNIINSIDKVSAPQAEKDLAKGQALFVRALAYFDLVRVFAKPYNQGNGSQAGVPIVLTSDVTAMPARNTVGEVYTQVIADLNAAKGLLGATSASTKFYATKFAASALLSRVYLYKGDNANVITEANNVTAGGLALTTAANLPNFYTTSGNGEEIFTLKFVSTESLGSNNLGNMYLKPGYGDIRVSPDLVAIFDKTKDARYTNYISAFSTSSTEFQNNKFKGEAGQQGMWSPKILRLAEVLLNRAEAYAKTDKATEALADLNAVRTARGLDALTGLSGQALVSAILEERRRELMFEGHRYFDLQRNGLAVVRATCTNTNIISTTKCTYEANANEAIAPIPQAELDANTGISGQQNPGY
jgi:hypothetical protein